MHCLKNKCSFNFRQMAPGVILLYWGTLVHCVFSSSLLCPTTSAFAVDKMDVYITSALIFNSILFLYELSLTL